MNYDEEYLKRLRERDPATWTQFFLDFAPILDNMLRYRGVNIDDIADLRNETFRRVLILNDRGKVNDASRFGAFVRGVCKHVIDEHFRKIPLTAWPEGFEPPDNYPSIEELLLDKEVRAWLGREIANLSPKERNLLIDVFFKRVNRRELAKKLGITVIAINVRIFKIMEKLRRNWRRRNDFPLSE